MSRASCKLRRNYVIFCLCVGEERDGDIMQLQGGVRATQPGLVSPGTRPLSRSHNGQGTMCRNARRPAHFRVLIRVINRIHHYPV
jgi:hypothetical protein